MAEEKTLPPGVAEWRDDSGNLHRGADTSPGYLAAKKRDAGRAAAEEAEVEESDSGAGDTDQTETGDGDTDTSLTSPSGTSWR